MAAKVRVSVSRSVIFSLWNTEPGLIRFRSHCLKMVKSTFGIETLPPLSLSFLDTVPDLSILLPGIPVDRRCLRAPRTIGQYGSGRLRMAASRMAQRMETGTEGGLLSRSMSPAVGHVHLLCFYIYLSLSSLLLRSSLVCCFPYCLTPSVLLTLLASSVHSLSLLYVTILLRPVCHAFHSLDHHRQHHLAMSSILVVRILHATMLLLSQSGSSDISCVAPHSIWPAR